MLSSPRKGRPHPPRRPAAPGDTARRVASERAVTKHTAHTPHESARARPRVKPEDTPRNSPRSSSQRTTASGRTPATPLSSHTNRRVRQVRARATTGPRQPKNRDQRERSDLAQERKNTARWNTKRSFVVGGLEISTRFLSVFLLTSVLAVLLLPNLYAWWLQEQELRDITARVQAAQERNEEMQHTLDLWQNPDYIASQARERLGYVKPGETQFTVIDPGEEYQDHAQIAAAQAQGPARPWVQVVALLLKEADAPSDSSSLSSANTDE